MPLFKFKQFSLGQDQSAMKIGTDGVLTGAWIPCEDAGSLLDIGTGTGLIALMAAQRSSAKIDAVEIEENAARQAKENFSNSPWHQRLHCIHQDFTLWADTPGEHSYDLIVSNPPYFRNSLKNPDISRATARHHDTLNPDSLLKGVARLLSPQGKFCMILPSDSLNSFSIAASAHGLYLTRAVQVHTRPDQPPKRGLIQMEKQPKETEFSLLLLYGEGPRGMSQEYIRLTKDFYLFL